MIKQLLLLSAACLALCFFVSCKETTNEEKTELSAKDSTNKMISEPESVADNGDACASTEADTSSIVENFSSLSDLNKRLKKKASYFVIKTNRDTVIKCKEGTVLSIPANAFLSASGRNSEVGEVRIAVKEFYKVSDMLMAGLTTASNDKLLETGGMINIKVTSRKTNDSCILKPGKNITIALANAEYKPVDGMQLFNGVHDSTHVNWEPQGGTNGLVQGWKGWGRTRSYSYNPYMRTAEFVFPDGVMKTKPALIHFEREKLQTEISLSLRELMQNVGVVTRKANGYIDTAGNLHCYRVSGINQKFTVNELYTPTTVQNIKVNLAVDVNLSYQSPLNRDYYQKLFRMGKGNADSLIVVTATLNPAPKITGMEKLKTFFENALTVKEYQVKERSRNILYQEFEKRITQLRLADENKLIQSVNSSSTTLQNVQSYFLMSTPKLGWINCDRFYNAPATIDYFVKLNEPTSLLIVFNSIKSILTSDRAGVFHNIPPGEKITIVGLKTDNGKLMMALHETTVSEKPFEQLQFKPVTVKEYKTRLEKLNRL